MPPNPQPSTPFAFQLLSDLHLELLDDPSPALQAITDIQPKAPTLALLGDIGFATGPKAAQLKAFLLAQLRKFDTVLYVPGNHEA
jgi:UDP-2,3-diacylglucosamine pyrophosphatase LpxH